MNPAVFALAIVLAATPQAELDQLRTQLIDAEKAFYSKVIHFAPCGAAATGEGPLRMQKFDVTSKGNFYDVALRLHRVALDDNRDFESITIKAIDNGNVTLDAKVVEACFDANATAHPPVTGPLGGDPVAMETRLYRERLKHLQSLTAEAGRVEERMQAMKALGGLEDVTRAWAEPPILLGELQFASGRLTARGIALGKPARESIEPGLRKGGFEKASVAWTPAGDCRAFTLTATRASLPASGEDHIGRDIFDERIATVCNAEPSAPAKTIAARGKGDFTLHARGIDAGSAFLLLHELNPVDGFVVEQSVTGPVDLSLDHVTRDEVFTALSGVAAVGPGPLHRVCNVPCSELREQKWEGEPISMMVSAADVLDLFRALKDVTGLEITARSLPGTVSVYAHEVEWDRLFAALVAATGKSYTIEGTTISLDRDGVPIEKLVTPIANPRRRLFEREPKKIALEDLHLAALISDGETWMAWARVPGLPKQLFRLEPGLELYDGKVEAVGAEQVTLRSADGKSVPLRFR